ncbi:MAG: hypothetical protein JRJ85_11485, partial [Deltaproteobacteria bacterium]|nr:hypothetical protein [Deltaproteobacteria bacterium]
MKNGFNTSNRQYILLFSLLLAVAVLMVFWPIQGHEFINFDDSVFILENIRIQSGLSFENLIWAFKTTYPDYWHPMPWISHMLDCQLYGLNPKGHHLNNLLLHIANALLLFLTLTRMTRAPLKSLFVAALFAFHPLHVESVAWITERKGVLSTFFWILTMWAYAWYAEHPRPARYLPVLFCFSLGLMSKPMLVTLPFVLLLMDYWPLKRPANGARQVIKLFLEKVPLFVLTGISAGIVFLLRQGVNIYISFEQHPLALRAGNALISYVGYIVKMIWPHRMTVLYPFPGTVSPWKVTGAALLLIGLTALLIRWRARGPDLLVGWLWYLVTLVPVIGLIQWGEWPAMADRFTYVPLTGLFIMVSWGMPRLFSGWRHGGRVLLILALLIISALALTTRIQLRHWKNSFSLFDHAAQVSKDNFRVHHILGYMFTKSGRLDK